MDSIVNRLTEIEDAASAIVQHADEQKEALDKEFDEKRKAFDAELEKNTSRLLDSQNGSSDAAIEALRREYSERHTEYAREILRRITEV